MRCISHVNASRRTERTNQDLNGSKTERYNGIDGNGDGEQSKKEEVIGI
jgi:hypothetical protein